MIKAFLVDFGGVLSLSGDLREIHKMGGEWVSFEEMRRRWDKAKVDEITLDDFLEGVESKEGVIQKYCNEEKLRGGYEAFLKELGKNYKLGLFSNHITGLLSPLLKTRNLEELFDVIVISGKGLAKPNKEFFLHACKELKVEPKECAFLDDLLMNLAPAKELGIKTIQLKNFVDHGLNSEPQYKGIKPDYTASSFKEVLEVAKSLNKK